MPVAHKTSLIILEISLCNQRIPWKIELFRIPSNNTKILRLEFNIESSQMTHNLLNPNYAAGGYKLANTK